jgi:hypothetical protein
VAIVSSALRSPLSCGHLCESARGLQDAGPLLPLQGLHDSRRGPKLHRNRLWAPARGQGHPASTLAESEQLCNACAGARFVAASPGKWATPSTGRGRPTRQLTSPSTPRPAAHRARRRRRCLGLDPALTGTGRTGTARGQQCTMQGQTRLLHKLPHAHPLADRAQGPAAQRATARSLAEPGLGWPGPGAPNFHPPSALASLKPPGACGKPLQCCRSLAAQPGRHGTLSNGQQAWVRRV